MKILKKILTFMLSATLLLSLAGCSNDNSNDTNSNTSNLSVLENDTNAMRDITSMELTDEMTIGWNLGNALDVCVADRDGDGKVNEEPTDEEKVDETLWGNVKTTKAVFEQLKKDGINAVRIPVTWRDHIGEAPDYKIDADWLNRVQEVVDYAYSLDMYVIINIHHDGGGDPQFGAWVRDLASSDYDAFKQEYTAIWTQIAKRFENYSDYLIFESMNEVGFDNLDKPAAYELLNKINQDFVDLIRSSGGNNPKRHLLIAGYWTDVEMTISNLFKMPLDPENRCILSVHYYTPWEFCTTNKQHTWGTDEEVSLMESKVNDLKTHFIDKGIPVIIGEYGTGGGNEDASRILFSSYFTELCHKAGIPAFLWDDGGVFDRTNLTWNTDGMLEALQKAVK